MARNEQELEGARAAQAYYTSPGFAGYPRYIRAEDAARLFLPPLLEQSVQMSTPLPKPRCDWLQGFKEEQANILAETSV
jgi:hypothetical protein